MICRQRDVRRVQQKLRRGIDSRSVEMISNAAYRTVAITE